MPLRKFRSIEEMNEFYRQRLREDDPRLFERIEAHWKRCEHFAPPLDISAGVHKFHTIDEMNAFKESHIDARIARIRAEKHSN
ncbi:MAG: hypothetical protein JWO97_3291 [Acidobacteria bacterium]|nr:hypothetical protein [Acidobacteriota bacterium]